MIETVRGFSDFTGEEAEKREYIRKKVESIFKVYGFEPAETPIIEQEEFVKGDNDYDEAVSDIFKLKDKGQRNLALRYEFTFQLKRLAQNKKLPYKRYQIGPVFRDEPVSANRFRQFTQCDVDVVGASIIDKAEVLATIYNICKSLKIDAEIQVNSRKMMNSAIKSLEIDNIEFVLREIDKIDKQGEDAVKLSMTKFIEKEKIVKLFRLLEKPLSFFRKYEGYKELKELIDCSENYGLKPVFNPKIARGLSYYNNEVFEVKTKEMKETIAGGGAFLINNIQAFGYGTGLERLSQLAKIKLESKKIMIISINQDKRAIKLAEKLRKQNIIVSMSDKVSKALEYANSKSINKVIFIGSEEIKKRKYKLRDMTTGKEEMLGEKELIEKII
ncbi:MAG: histidine--tRNA ligase [Nanoarchaeota archaeon]|nr:histidine--tRNA ligase [Nanoarchaeota archaeon]MBU4086218.1 histidine--tRNA ligase [Nanoarchaeota archaeon]